MKKKLTEGNVLGNVILFSLPYMLFFFLQTLYGLADLFIIGKFNATEAVTAVSVGSQVMHMLTVMIVGLAMGTTVAVGRAAGAENKKKVSLVIGNTAVLFMLISAVLSIFLFLSAGFIARLMSTPAEAFSGTVDYLRICFAGIPFITAYNVISAVFRGLGDSKSPLYFIAFACVCNICLDCLFIGAFHMGPSGAALGTAISQALSVIFAFAVILRKTTGLKIEKRDLKIRKDTVGEILRVGIPVSLQDGFIQVAFIIITVIANRRGLYDAAAVGIVEKIIGILFIVPSSMLSTVSALASQNLGAGKPLRARLTLRYAAIISAVFGTLAAFAVQIKAPYIVGLFENSTEVLRFGSSYLQSYVWDCVFAGIHFCFSGYFCAVEKSEISFFHNIISIILIRVPGAYFASKAFADTLFPMGLAAPIGSLLSVIICLTAYIIITKRSTAEY